MIVSGDVAKDELIARAHRQMLDDSIEMPWDLRQKLALTCRILFDGGHDSGLAGQITARGEEPRTYLTQRFGYGFDEIAASNLVHVDEALNVICGEGMPNPANRFHSWIYDARSDVQCIIHTHPPHVSALSTLETPLMLAHMDTCLLYDQVAFLPKWPGIPVGNEEGEAISEALGDKRAILLAHHGMLVTGRSVEEACVLAVVFERAARMQLLAMAAGNMQPIVPELGRQARDWMSTPKRYQLAFAYSARTALKRHAGCLA